MKKITRIVVGTDFSAPAEKAFDDALDLAEQLGATVTLVHAYEVPVVTMPDSALVAANIERMFAAQGQAGLAAALRRAGGRRVAIRSVLRVGSASTELDSVAAEEKADLIVVGTHGRRGISRVLMGSVAERLVRTATRPVLVVHTGDGQASVGVRSVS